MERLALFAIIGIVVVSLFAVVAVDSLTGAAYYSGAYSAGGYSGNKIYGGAIRRAMAKDPLAFGGYKYADEIRIQRGQAYLYANKDKWDCTYGKEAETSPHPCVFDESLQKYCCVKY